MDTIALSPNVTVRNGDSLSFTYTAGSSTVLATEVAGRWSLVRVTDMRIVREFLIDSIARGMALPHGVVARD